MRLSWDVIIAGASFAGLATATEIEADAAILDRFDVGSYQTSACGTFVRVLSKFGCEDSILRTFDTLVLHMPRPIHIPLIQPLCTFDHRRLCEGLSARSRARFFRATVQGLQGNEVVTDAGRFHGRYFIDATGWHAALTDTRRGDGRSLAFGLEVDTDWEDENIHFIVNPHIVPWGAAWIFPTDVGSRVGVGSSGPRRGLESCLATLLRCLGVEGRGIHGAAIPWDLRGGTQGNVFLVGDSAGMALPLTLEGIRRSLEEGRLCGAIVNDVTQGRLSLEEGLRRYDAVVRRSVGAYRSLTFIQGLWERDWMRFSAAFPAQGHYRSSISVCEMGARLATSIRFNYQVDETCGLVSGGAGRLASTENTCGRARTRALWHSLPNWKAITLEHLEDDGRLVGDVATHEKDGEGLPVPPGHLMLREPLNELLHLVEALLGPFGQEYHLVRNRVDRLTSEEAKDDPGGEIGDLGIQGSEDTPAFHITMEDSEAVVAAIRGTPPQNPIDLIVHTPGGIAFAAELIAMALKLHPGAHDGHGPLLRHVGSMPPPSPLRETGGENRNECANHFRLSICKR